MPLLALLLLSSSPSLCSSSIAASSSSAAAAAAAAADAQQQQQQQLIDPLAPVPPYPLSPLATTVSISNISVAGVHPGDTWPSTWGSDGNMYLAGCDNPPAHGSKSVGTDVFRLEGTPEAPKSMKLELMNAAPVTTVPPYPSAPQNYIVTCRCQLARVDVAVPRLHDDSCIILMNKLLLLLCRRAFASSLRPDPVGPALPGTVSTQAPSTSRARACFRSTALSI
eukprot:COSAG01_NODE_182_length_22838_cov_34.788733_10_plen_224_part_00